MENKYIIIDLRTMDYFKKDDKVVIFDTLEDAGLHCGMYEFENVWICQLVFNHIENLED
jgi:hypothetical protein